MDKIKDFILPEHFNQLYTKEAISSISLTREIASKINELIHAYNDLSDWNLAKHQEQDGTIRKGILYMKDNLLNTLNDLMTMFRDSGYIDDRILFHFNTIKGEVELLDQRLDNLLGSVTEGTSTLDAEIIDGRVDSDRAVWNTLGDLIRSIHDDVSLLLNGSYFTTEKVDTTIINGWLNRAGEYRSNAETGEQHKCIKFEVKGGERYLIYSEYGWDMSDAVALDEGNTMVKLYNTAEERKTNDGNMVIVIPDKAKYLVVNSMYPSKKPVSARKIVACNNKGITDYVDNAVMSVKGTKPILSENIITNTKTGHAIRSGEEFTIDNQGFIVGECSVEQGNIYKIVCGGSFECNPYAFYNSTGVCIGYMPVLPATGYEAKEYTVIAPMGAKTLKVAHYNSTTPAVYQIKGYGYTEAGKWDHIKWCCLGDSLTELNDRTDKHYFDYIKDQTGIQITNMGVGGTGYKRGYEDNNAFYQRAENIPTCDVITIFGSGNDGTYSGNIGTAIDTGTETLCGCINATIDVIHSKNPTVKLGIVSPSPWINQHPSNKQCFMSKYSEALKEICELRGIPFLDLYHCSGFRPDEEKYRNLVFSKDEGNGVHPNELGHKILSSHFYHFIDSLISTY